MHSYTEVARSGAVTGEFFRFPRTPHLLRCGPGKPLDDLLFTAAEARRFLSAPILVEEKIDGANLGLSLDPRGRLRAQSRGRCRLGAPGNRPQSVRGWIGDNPSILLETKQIQATGWKAKLTIEQGIVRTLRWLEANRWVYEVR